MADLDERQQLVAEFARACQSNPTKTVVQILLRAAAHAPSFTPEDATDSELLAGLRMLAVEPPRTGF